MTLEINPVLAGTIGGGNNYIPPNNLANNQTEDVSGVDTRRYTKFDRTAADAGSTTSYSFNDLLDLVNPLQHVPVLSSVYRSVTGEKINPISRIAGDMLYGGLVGAGSAVLGGLGAAGEAVMEAQTGKDPSGNVIAALFGPDSPAQAATQLASADAAAPTLSGSSQTVTAAAPTTALASLVAPAPSAIAALSPLAAPAPASPPDASPAEASPVQASPPDALPPAPAPAKAMLASLGPKPAPITTDQAAVINRLAAGDPATIAKLAAANPKKLPFGGVMDPSTLQGSNMALALASSAPGLQMGNTVYTGRALNGLKPGFATAGYNGAVLPASATTGVAGGATMIQAQASQTTDPTSSLVAASSGTDPNASSFATGTHNPLPAALISDIETLRAINQYQNAARMSVPGAKAINLN